MDNQQPTTRRTAFKGLALAGALIAFPGASLASPPIRDTIAKLIEAHRAAYAAYDAATALECDAEETAAAIFPPPLARVLLWRQVSLHGQQDTSVYAASRREIEEASRRRGIFYLGNREPERMDWVEAKCAELAAAQRAHDEWERAAGVTAARVAMVEAGKAEREARLALTLFVPRTAADAEAKRAYFAESQPFVGKWADDEFCDSLIDLLCEVQS